MLAQKYPYKPLDLWQQHEQHQNCSESSQRMANSLIEQIVKLTIAESSSRSTFLKKFDILINNHDNVAKEHLPDGTKTSFL